MTKSPVLLLLAGLQMLAAIALGALCYLHVRFVRELNDQNARLLNFTSNRQFVTSLATDCAEYSKRNPAIDPILASIGVKSPRAAASAASPSAPPSKPAVKPGAR